MKILIIDNHSQHIGSLAKCFRKNSIKIAKVNELQEIDFSFFDAFIISGSSKYSVVSNFELYKEEISLIKNTHRPILGICLGFEMICYCFNEKLIFNNQKIRGFYEISLEKKERIFKGIKQNIEAFKSHRWRITQTKFLKSIAFSETGIEAVRHPKKNIYGFQFHPEVNCGVHEKLIDNFIEIAKSVKTKRNFGRVWNKA